MEGSEEGPDVDPAALLARRPGLAHYNARRVQGLPVLRSPYKRGSQPQPMPRQRRPPQTAKGGREPRGGRGGATTRPPTTAPPLSPLVQAAMRDSRAFRPAEESKCLAERAEERRPATAAPPRRREEGEMADAVARAEERARRSVAPRPRSLHEGAAPVYHLMGAFHEADPRLRDERRHVLAEWSDSFRASHGDEGQGAFASVALECEARLGHAVAFTSHFAPPSDLRTAVACAALDRLIPFMGRYARVVGALRPHFLAAAYPAAGPAPPPLPEGNETASDAASFEDRVRAYYAMDTHFRTVQRLLDDKRRLVALAESLQASLREREEAHINARSKEQRAHVVTSKFREAVKSSLHDKTVQSLSSQLQQATSTLEEMQEQRAEDPAEEILQRATDLTAQDMERVLTELLHLRPPSQAVTDACFDVAGPRQLADAAAHAAARAARSETRRSLPRALMAAVARAMPARDAWRTVGDVAAALAEAGGDSGPARFAALQSLCEVLEDVFSAPQRRDLVGQLLAGEDVASEVLARDLISSLSAVERKHVVLETVQRDQLVMLAAASLAASDGDEQDALFEAFLDGMVDEDQEYLMALLLQSKSRMCISLLQSLLEQQQLEVPRKAARATVLASDRAFPPSLVDAIARERRGRRQTTPSTAGADRGLREVGKDLSKRVGAGDEAPTRRKPSSTEGRTRRRAGGKRRHRSRSASDCGGKTRVPAPWASAGPEALAPGADPRAGVALEWVSESAAAARDGRGRAAVDPAVLVGSGSTWAALARSHADWPLVSKPITKLSTLRNLVYGLYERKLKGDLAALGSGELSLGPMADFALDAWTMTLGHLTAAQEQCLGVAWAARRHMASCPRMKLFAEIVGMVPCGSSLTGAPSPDGAEREERGGGTGSEPSFQTGVTEATFRYSPRLGVFVLHLMERLMPHMSASTLRVQPPGSAWASEATAEGAVRAVFPPEHTPRAGHLLALPAARADAVVRAVRAAARAPPPEAASVGAKAVDVDEVVAACVREWRAADAAERDAWAAVHLAAARRLAGDEGDRPALVHRGTLPFHAFTDLLLTCQRKYHDASFSVSHRESMSLYERYVALAQNAAERHSRGRAAACTAWTPLPEAGMEAAFAEGDGSDSDDSASSAASSASHSSAGGRTVRSADEQEANEGFFAAHALAVVAFDAGMGAPVGTGVGADEGIAAAEELADSL